MISLPLWVAEDQAIPVTQSECPLRMTPSLLVRCPLKARSLTLIFHIRAVASSEHDASFVTLELALI
jgi:hypothetical protein